MKQWIHSPTIIFHLLLLLDAAATINDYSDFFLISVAILLLLYFIFIRYAVRSKTTPKSILLSYLIGCIAQSILFFTGVIDVNSGAFGLGGGEFALIFYVPAMAVSFPITVLIVLLSIPKKR